MSLEEVEEKAIQFLKHVSNPLVLVDVLQSHLENECPTYSMTKELLLDFIEDHEEFKLFESPQLEGASGLTNALSEDGFMGGPYVILATRVPTPDQLAAMMVEQLQHLGEALSQALAHAREADDTARQEAVQQALKRTSTLLKKLIPNNEDE